MELRPDQLDIGDSVVYKLRPDQRPTNPLREYHGLVTAILYGKRAVLVDLLDPEYEGMNELVLVSQIVEVRRIPC